MREIKFRYVFRNDETGHIALKIFALSHLDVSGGLAFRDMFEAGYSIIAKHQYTGMEAKNGDIYEGDLVKFKYTSRNGVKYLKRVVFYDETFARFSTMQENDEDGEYLDESADMEIMGDIHSNPELLEKEQ